MRHQQDDLRDCASAYECRDRLPDLAAWMSDEVLKQVPIWQGARFERGQEYFDLDNPERGPFVATGDEHRPTDHTYVCRRETPERAWAQLVTWRQPVSADEGQALAWEVQNLGIGRERSAAGDARPLPPE
ncbi:MAG TPA: hypothetical protein VK066_21820 [Chloroflexota bacterium]|nr:hypothetical protein [Chloroflexota bacterium]